MTALGSGLNFAHFHNESSHAAMNLSPYITAVGSLNTGAAADGKLIEPVAGCANGQHKARGD